MEVFMGSVSIDWEAVFASEESASQLIFQSRLYRCITGLLVGGGAAIAGAIIQTLFKNPLAGPTTLGITSGASLGAGFFYLLPFAAGFHDFGVTFFSCLGSIIYLLFLMFISGKNFNLTFVLIIGLLLSYASYSVIEVFIQFSSDSGLRNYVFWGMGSLNNISLVNLITLVSIVLGGLLFSLKSARFLNVYSLGDNELFLVFRELLKSKKLVLLLVAGLIVGVSTSIVGPIAFVGIVVPNLLKLLLKTSKHQKILPLSFLFGGGMVLLADLLSRGVFFSIALPLNAVLSVFGVPIIIITLIKKIRFAGN